MSNSVDMGGGEGSQVLGPDAAGGCGRLIPDLVRPEVSLLHMDTLCRDYHDATVLPSEKQKYATIKLLLVAMHGPRSAWTSPPSK